MSNVDSNIVRLCTRYGGLLLVVIAAAFCFPDLAHAAISEPDSSGTYNYLQMAEENKLRIYAKPGETISYTILRGYGSGSDLDACGEMSLQRKDAVGTGFTDIRGVTISGLAQGGNTFSNINQTARDVLTCSGVPNPYQWITISYKIPSNASAVTSMEGAYRALFQPHSGNKTKDRSYRWNVTVTGVDGLRQYGRVWFVGDDSAGLAVHQDDSWIKAECSTNNEKMKVRIQPSRNVAYTYKLDGTTLTLKRSNTTFSTYDESWNEFEVDNNMHQLTFSNSNETFTRLITPSGCGGSGWQTVDPWMPMENATNHSFQFVRADGYRYNLQYNNYQGIWSVFHGGVYGARISSSGTDKNDPAYRSYAQKDTNFHYTLGSGDDNVAYIFVDCKQDVECPRDIPTSFLRSKPITREGSPITTSAGTFDSNPIANENYTTVSTDPGFTYTGYTGTRYDGGTVRVPYMAMQTGYIDLTVNVNGSIVCTKKILVDDEDGAGVKTWTFTSTAANATTGLGSCDGGAWKSPSARPSPFRVSTSSKLTITVQATHLGEMHFIDIDTEQRGSIAVTGNDTYGGSSTMLGWYDPFSRIRNDICGLIPSRIGGTIREGGLDSQGMVDNTSSDPTLWDSMSSDTKRDGTLIARRLGNLSGGAESDRRLTNSSGGVHGWTFTNRDSCDAFGSGTNDGRAKEDGTATTESTWGNNRVVDDWTYAVNDPESRVISLGPNYELEPIVSLVPAASISPGQSVKATPQVRKSGTSPAEHISWTLYAIVFSPGATPDTSLRSGTDSTRFGCSVNSRAAGSVSCDAVRSGTDVTFNNGNTIFSDPDTFTKTDTAGLQVGSRVCFSLVVNPYALGGGYSEAANCVIVAATPYIAVVGGNVWAGGSTDTPYRGYALIRGGETSDFGSFGEYGVFATRTIDYFGSAARIGSPSTTTTYPDGTKLTFGSKVSLGNFTDTHKITNLLTRYAGTGSTNVMDATNKVTTSGVYRSNADVTISGLTGNPKAVIYAPNNTVTISGDIVYSSAGATRFKDLPSLTVIAQNIVVDSAVGEIAGNYYATQTFVTCAQGPRSPTDPNKSAIISSGDCSAKRLTVNGTVTVARSQVNSLVLNRSLGGTQAGQPAEVIRMRPESFLTDYENNLILTTIDEIELPPRY